MAQATMTSKGQITVPKDIRDELNLRPGSKVMFVRLGPGDVRIVPRTGKLADLAGLLRHPGNERRTIEEINADIAESGAASGLQGLDASDDDVSTR